MFNFYKTSVWKSRREKILRRDKYCCRECKRYGKNREATTVHHVNPLEDYPQWRLESWNLISLCGKCHEKMHDRITDKLTALGLQWVERVERMKKIG
ncbi:HNH endonuclease [Bacillus mesophilum]|uniref:Putative HNH nuclease YajD n=1 Tax=Bacillus mesophilum TaxID=1071718 RepID=A0A7V7RNV0_9BACI|nr:HNH endonuclease [Bacillus mesophilum]KAB2334268.1 HNH endonuclease [Bacillus mesophilum]